MSRLSVRSLSKSFGDRQVLSNIGFDVGVGESFVIIGGSGTGKSVLIKCLLGLIPFDAGEVVINGHNLHDLSRSEKRAIYQRFGMLFQGGALFDSMTVVDNVAFGLIHGVGMGKAEAHRIAYEKLEAVDLVPEHVASVYPAELSGGMQKRVALARAIAPEPDMIFFDEPTTGLDPIVGGTINELILRCVRDLGASTITITHDMHSVRTVGDHVGLLFQGKFVWIGGVSEMENTTNPYVYQFIRGLPNGPFTTT